MANRTPEPVQSVLDSGRPFIIDGGLGGELDRRGVDISSSLWSARLIRDNPQALLDVHRAYLQAGARCITTASYQASVPGLLAAGFAEQDLPGLIQSSVTLAIRACDEFCADNPGADRPLVAASIGPYGAYLADGSEYRGNYGVPADRLRDFHARRLQWLDASGADLLACETIPDLLEAEVLAGLLRTTRTPAWVSFCCRDDGHLHDGNTLANAARLFRGHSGVFAVGVNCCDPSVPEVAIPILRSSASDKLVIVYPNSGEGYNAQAKSWQANASSSGWCDEAARWFAAGAQILGGCCRIGPNQIEQLAVAFAQGRAIDTLDKKVQ